MRTLIALFMITSLITFSNTFANPPAGKGPGSHGFGTGVSNMPPGLQQKGLPPGLNKNNKTPYGWSQGKKTGWHKKHYNTHGYYDHVKGHKSKVKHFNNHFNNKVKLND